MDAHTHARKPEKRKEERGQRAEESESRIEVFVRCFSFTRFC